MRFDDFELLTIIGSEAFGQKSWSSETVFKHGGEVQWKKLIKPLGPASVLHRHEKIKLSFIDELQSPSYVGIIFYYKDHAEEQEIDALQRLRRMEDLLSETLTLFYPFAGRYFEDGHFIDCNDEGVEFVLANLDGRIDQLLQQQPDRNLLQCMLNFPGKIFDNPLLTIQVNLFSCGGLVIGLRFMHKIGDVCTMVRFMKSWISVCNSSIREIAHPNFELSSIFPLSESLLPQWSPPPIGKDKLVMNRLVFDSGTISKMKAQFRSLAPSSFEVASALICRTFINIDERKYGKLRPFVVSMTMNLRERVGITIPADACGNLFALVTGRSKIKLELEELVTLIGDALRHARTRYEAVPDGEKLCLLAKDSMADLQKIALTNEANIIHLTSWCKFPLYDSDFGWGKPVLVSSTSPPFKTIVLTDNDVDGRINAWITLDEEEMTLFKQDPNISASTVDYLV